METHAHPWTKFPGKNGVITLGKSITWNKNTEDRIQNIYKRHNFKHQISNIKQPAWKYTNILTT